MRSPGSRRLLFTALVLAAVLSGRVAAAAPAAQSPILLEVVTGPQGELGQWLVAGPEALPGQGPGRARLVEVPLGTLAGKARPGVPIARPGGRGSLSWRILAQGEATMDLRRALGLRAGAGYQAALLGLRMDAAAAMTAHLQLGHDDAVAVFLNGQRLLHAEGQRSFDADHWLVLLPLQKGENHLVLAMGHGRGGWRVRARLTGPDHCALGRGSSAGRVRLLLPLPQGVTADAPTLGALAARALAPGVRRRLTSTGLEVAATLEAPAGVLLPPGGRMEVLSSLSAGPARPPTRHEVDLRALAASPAGWSCALAWPGGGRAEQGALRVTLPQGHGKAFTIRRASGLAARIAAAEAARSALTPGPRIPEGSLATVDYHLGDIRRRLLTDDPGARALSRRLSWVERWLRTLAKGRDPLARVRGRVVMAYRDPLDGSLQPYSLFVPVGHPGREGWPLVVMLHGMGGDHRQGLLQILGTWPASGSPLAWDELAQKSPPLAFLPKAIVLAPQGFGDAFYRHAGERDVLRAIAEVTRRFRVDPSRVVLVGHSMGGTGALDLGLRYPHRFAGIVALAAYPTRFEFPDVRQGPLAPHERFLAELLSPLRWAENGRHLPLIAVHGTADGPWRSRAVVDAWKRLGQRAELKLFPTGHDVWRQIFDRGQIFADTAAWRTPRAPDHVTLRTPRLRWGRAHWVTVTSRGDSGAWSRVDARLLPSDRQGNRLRVQTRNVEGLELGPSGAGYSARRPSRVVLDGETLTVPAGALLHFHRRVGRWQAGAPPSPASSAAPGTAPPSLRKRWQAGAPPSPASSAAPGTAPPSLRKRPGLEGPLDDLHHGPVLVVVGTRDPAERAALARVGEALRRYGLSEARYGLKTDAQVTAEDRRRYHLILVGAAHANLETARHASRLPIRITRQAVEVGPRRFVGADVGALFTYPNPEAPNRYLVILAGTTAQAALRHHRLPAYLPDFVVFDRSIEAGDSVRVLGPTRRYLAAGFFDAGWRLPKDLQCPAARPSASFLPINAHATDLENAQQRYVRRGP